MTVAKRILTGCLLVLALGRGQAAEWLNAGPLFDDFALTLAPGHRTEALGPLFYFEEKETQQTWAVPPLFSYVRDPVTDFVECDFVYPLLTYDRFRSGHRWPIFPI